MPSLILTDNKNQGGSKTMDEKYMKIKKLTIPTITMVIIASQLLGCNAVSQSELLQMINNGDMIEIEVAVPQNVTETDETLLNWIILASLTTNPDLRKEWDNKLNILVSEDSKNGVLYVNTDGKNEPNNTLRVALHNREFIKALEDKTIAEALANAAELAYTDIDAEENQDKAFYIALNGYFNLLPDSEDGASYADDALSRKEFMAMVARSELQVDETLTSSDDFNILVGKSEYNAFAEQVASDSYLDTATKSLNNKTYNGTMTRAEAIYLLVNHYFKSDLASVDVSTATFTDAKDGGDIATAQKFIENGTEKDYCRDYELVYATQNPDKGLPTDLYKALVVAKNKGLITEDTRWDEGITKSEALQLLVEALKQETGIPIFTFKQGENILEPTVDMNSTEVDSNAQDADVKISEEPETTEDAKSSSNPFSGMTYDELGAIDTTNFTDADWNNYITACQEAEAALAKNKPATEKQPWTGKPFEEMTQEELKAIDTETLTKEDKDRWIKRYDETIVEKLAEFDQQNQNSGNTTTPAQSGDDAKWANPPEKETPVADGWKCY